MIWFSADLHLNHNKPFIYESRGFKNIQEMNKAIITQYNEVVNDDDIVYILGDLCLGGIDCINNNYELLSQLKGHIYIIRGNHDTDNRLNLYRNINNIQNIEAAAFLRYNKYHFFLCHFPTCTTNFDDNKKPLTQRTLNICGHTHSKELFEPCGSYNVSVDAHNCYPVPIEQIILDFETRYKNAL